MIIQSALDNDYYKFTMLQSILHRFASVMVKYRFKCRTPDIDFRAYVDNIIKEINKMCKEIRFTKEDLEYLGDMKILKQDTLQFLKLFKFDYAFLHITCDDSGTLHIIIDGPWLHTILYEIPILSIVSEVYSKDISTDYYTFEQRTKDKIKMILKLKEETGISLSLAEFGGRRRHSVASQYTVLDLFKSLCLMSTHGTGLIGTSNVMMAKKHGIKVIGTMAHEWLQAHQALYRVADSQTMALENWVQEYRGNLGIALSDVIGLKYFLHDFDLYFSKLFDGTRQDSGDPVTYGNRMIKHYIDMRIEPITKNIVFSNSLNIPKCIDLVTYFDKKIKTSYGVGTNLTNDFGFKPLNIVLKMIECNGNPVAKISDDPGKSMCNDDSYMNYLIDSFERRIKQ